MTRIALAASLAALLALTACATATETPEPTPTPTPTAISAVQAPEPRVPLSCNDFTEIVVHAMQQPADSLRAAGAYGANNGTVAGRQAGLLRCRWVDEAEANQPIPTSMSISVLPDAAGPFKARTDYGHAATRYDVFGDGSRLTCTWHSEGGGYCSGSLLVGTSWVEFIMDLNPTAVLDLQTTRELGISTGESLADMVEADGPSKPAYEIDPTAARWTHCVDLDLNAHFREWIQSPSLLTPYEGVWGPAGDIAYASLAKGHMKSCVWTRDDFYNVPLGEVRQISIEVVIGAGWAWPDFEQRMLEAQAEPVEIIGADEAYITCSYGSYCSVTALVRGSYVGANISYNEDSGEDARATIIAALEFVIPLM